jgi:flagellar basal-body rod protein FlgC
MRLISENIANADSTAQAAGGDPYRRRIVTSEPSSTVNSACAWSRSAASNPTVRRSTRHEPDNPAADAKATSNIRT